MIATTTGLASSTEGGDSSSDEKMNT
jgi:hypothetical protein